MRITSLLCLTLGVSLVTVAPATAETPTPAQQQAIRSNCVGDYRKDCSGVPTGGMDALICLEQHVDSLSPACKSAVEAVEPASSSATQAAAPETAAKPAEAAAAPATAKPAEGGEAGAPAAAEPRLSFRQELRVAGGSCAVDFRLFCPNLPVGHGNVLFCLRVHWQRLDPHCRDALAELGVSP